MDISELNGKTIYIIEGCNIDRLAELIASKMPQQMAQPAPPINEETLLTFAETCKFLGISRPTGTRWRNAGKISGHLMGGKLYFFKSELLNALKNGE